MKFLKFDLEVKRQGQNDLNENWLVNFLCQKVQKNVSADLRGGRTCERTTVQTHAGTHAQEHLL